MNLEAIWEIIRSGEEAYARCTINNRETVTMIYAQHLATVAGRPAL